MSERMRQAIRDTLGQVAEGVAVTLALVLEEECLLARIEGAAEERKRIGERAVGLLAEEASTAVKAQMANLTADCQRHRIRAVNLEREQRQLHEVIRWALGENGEFPAREPGQGVHWWREELRRRFVFVATPVSGDIDAPPAEPAFRGGT